MWLIGQTDGRGETDACILYQQTTLLAAGAGWQSLVRLGGVNTQSSLFLFFQTFWIKNFSLTEHKHTFLRLMYRKVFWLFAIKPIVLLASLVALFN